MDVDFLLIGNGLTGEIKKYDYPRKKLHITEVTVQSAANPGPGNHVRSFDAVLHQYNGKTYAVGIGQSTDSIQMEGLIDSKKPNPVPESLLLRDDSSH